MTKRLNELPKELWDSILAQADDLYEKTFKIDQECQYGDLEQLEGGVDATIQYGTQKGESLKTGRGSVIVKGKILEGLHYDLAFEEVTPEMSKEERNGKLCKYIYYQNEEQEKYFKSKFTELKDQTFFYYQINEINVPMVSNREFAALRIMKVVEREPKLKVCIVTATPETSFDFGAKKVQRAVLHNYNIYDEIDDNSFKVTQFFYCNPMGKIPASFFNKTLTSQLGFLNSVKKHVETKK